jgi:membrane associated rhomboid family serine protease
MGIADRHYSTDPETTRRGFGGLRGLSMVSFNTWLIVANCAVFVIQAFGSRGVRDMITEYGHFSTFEAVRNLEFWRLITFQFLHANIMHLAFNMFGLYMFGTLAERHLGFKKYAAFYLVCGIFGGLMYLALNLLGTLAQVFGMTGVPGLLYSQDTSTLFSQARLVGASAGVFGVIMAAAYVAPRSKIQLLIPPIELEMKTFAYAYVGIAVVSVLIGTQNAGGEAAHLGGAIAGYFFIRRSHLLADFFDVFTDSRGGGSSSGQRAGRAGGNASAGKRGGLFARIGGAVSRSAPGAPPDREEIDRILDKVRQSGLASLTDREKDTLRKATEAERNAGR